MVIHFTKNNRRRDDDKPHTLTCRRDDGSQTWQPSSEFFVRHDLVHYAVETVLGYNEAFLGLVARGKDLDAFGTRNGVKDVYTFEEGWAETIVGLLQWFWPSDDALFDALATACANGGIPVPPLTPAQLARIRAAVTALHAEWERLPEGAVLERAF